MTRAAAAHLLLEKGYRMSSLATSNTMSIPFKVYDGFDRHCLVYISLSTDNPYRKYYKCKSKCKSCHKWNVLCDMYHSSGHDWNKTSSSPSNNETYGQYFSRSTKTNCTRGDKRILVYVLALSVVFIIALVCVLLFPFINL
ncbi:hypothetical protein AMTRI_Chr03g49020 [Amborella trichopoda]|uniref:uncharacterized protein LOC110006611 n=1 Tax=Amborella trichopoda TaxID=13333 RepID=UPI0009BCC59A|nr:uncharacterized protein LOC110006611 [Amborella trichopoda]|eukprot:XP_020518371.1 uncharacterized protein LOC110006611 [Amborella trichopoda]